MRQAVTIPILVNVWSVGLLILHLAVYYLLYVSLIDDCHQPFVLEERSSDAEEDRIGRWIHLA